MNDHGSPKLKSKNFGPLRVTPDYRRGLKISLNKCPTYYYIDISILTKLVLEVIGVASIPKFIIYAIAVCTQISYEKFGPPQVHAWGCRGLKISLNKCAFLLLYRYLTKLVLEVIGVDQSQNS